MLYNWKTAFANTHYRNRFILSISFLLMVLVGFAFLVAYIETRQGHTLYDPILNFIKPRDVSEFIFFVTYLAGLVGLIYAISSPYKFLHLIQMYSSLTLLRLLILFFIPFDPPMANVPIHEGFLINTFYAGNEHLKDLFLSGHAATLFLFYFFITNKFLKYTLLLAAISVSVGVMVQHMHYSYDVIAAPIFAYIAYRGITKFSKHYQNETPLANS